ncbi:MAG: hypothetical protein E7511_02280 [Ruminococcus sp.]|nr:hypothetical protein [Ruminococcus sp.]
MKRWMAGWMAMLMLVSLAGCGVAKETGTDSAKETTVQDTTREEESEDTNAKDTDQKTEAESDPETSGKDTDPSTQQSSDSKPAGNHTESSEGTGAPPQTGANTKPATKPNTKPTTKPATTPQTNPSTTAGTTATQPATQTGAVTDPTGDTTVIPVPEQPATDAPVPTEPVTGPTKIVGGCMVVDSGTANVRALELFSNNFKNCEKYAGILNSYKSQLGDGVNVYCMVVPTSCAFYMPESEAPKYGNQLENYNRVAQNLNGVIGVPVYGAIEAHKNEYLYSRTDYHWQPRAAYYAAEQFAASAGVPYAPLETYTPVERQGYVGAFYRVNGIKELANAPEPFTYYKPANLDQITATYYNTAFSGGRVGNLFFENNSIAASYTVFVGRDDCILQVDTNVDNDRVLVIFKDSYGNALVPFLTQSFERIYLCDFRYFDRNAASFIREVGGTDLLFAMSTVAITTSSKIRQVENNLWK